MNRKYKALRAIKTMYQLVAVLSIGGAAIGLIAIVYPDSTLSGEGLLIAGVISGISFYAIAEGIELAIDIAENTARTADLLEARRKPKPQ